MRYASDLSAARSVANGAIERQRNGTYYIIWSHICQAFFTVTPGPLPPCRPTDRFLDRRSHYTVEFPPVSAHLSADLVKPLPATADLPTPSIPWIGVDDFLRTDDAAGMSPALRMLLASDGTITTLLRALCLSPIQVEVLRQEEIKLAAAAAEFLSVEPESSALAREVWLTADDQRLVCASSLILMEGLDRMLLQALRNRQKPLGRLLHESGLPVLRDRLQIASVADPSRIKALGLTGPGPVWMRRYRMSLKSKSIALIQEQFIGPPLRSGK